MTHSLTFWRDRLLDKCTELPSLLPHAAVEALRAAHYAQAHALSPEDSAICEAAALIHDIGKAPSLVRCGFHPLDGAAYVLEQGGDQRLAAFVAYHSSAIHEASLLGLTIPYTREVSTVSRIIDWCDMTTLQSGLVVTIEERKADILARYGADSTPYRALLAFWPELLETQRLIAEGDRGQRTGVQELSPNSPIPPSGTSPYKQ